MQKFRDNIKRYNRIAEKLARLGLHVSAGAVIDPRIPSTTSQVVCRIDDLADDDLILEANAVIERHLSEVEDRISHYVKEQEEAHAWNNRSIH